MDDDVDYNSTTTMTSVTEETDDNSSDAGGSGLNEVSSVLTVSVTETNDEDNETILVCPPEVKEKAKIKVKEPANAEMAASATQAQQNKNKKFLGKFQLPDFQNSQRNWYQHDCFKHYWQHYQFVSLWCQKHMEVYKAIQQQYTVALSTALASQTAVLSKNAGHPQDQHVFKKPVSSRTHRNRKARRRRKAAKKRLMMSLSYSETTDSNTSLSEKEEEEGTEVQMEEETIDSLTDLSVEMHMEISEEMLDFFAHTHKHRLERDAKKTCEKTKKEEKLINIEEVRGDQKERTVEAPKEQPGSRRTAEMRLLYGKGAAMIHGMETALQMNFDRNLDVRQPKLWPNMPFKVIFNS